MDLGQPSECVHEMTIFAVKHSLQVANGHQKSRMNRAGGPACRPLTCQCASWQKWRCRRLQTGSVSNPESPTLTMPPTFPQGCQLCRRFISVLHYVVHVTRQLPNHPKHQPSSRNTNKTHHSRQLSWRHEAVLYNAVHVTRQRRVLPLEQVLHGTLVALCACMVVHAWVHVRGTMHSAFWCKFSSAPPETGAECSAHSPVCLHSKQ